MCCRHCHKLLRQHPSSEPLLAGGVVPAAVTSEDWAKPALRASHNTRRTQRSPGCQLGLFCSLLPLQGCGQPSWAGIKDQCQPWCGSAGQGDQGINLFRTQVPSRAGGLWAKWILEGFSWILSALWLQKLPHSSVSTDGEERIKLTELRMFAEDGLEVEPEWNVVQYFYFHLLVAMCWSSFVNSHVLLIDKEFYGSCYGCAIPAALSLTVQLAPHKNFFFTEWLRLNNH